MTKQPRTVTQTIEGRLAALEQRVSLLEKLSVANTPEAHQQTRGSKQLSIKEFINQKKPRSGRELTLTVGYFLEHHEGNAPFSVQDLEQGFRSGKVPPPKNINDMVNKNIRAGFFMESKEKKDGRKAWEVTATGEALVETGFEKK